MATDIQFQSWNQIRNKVMTRTVLELSQGCIQYIRWHLIIKIEGTYLRIEPMLQISNCYKVLHLEEDCSDLELRQRYRKCALESHPDKLKTECDDQKDQIQKKFLRFNQAYKRIVNYRKHLLSKSQKQAAQRERRQLMREERLLSFEEIRQKLMTLTKGFQLDNSFKSPVSGYSCEINRIYEQHMSILDNLSLKLRTMKQR